MGINPVNRPAERRAVFLDRDGVINQVFVRDGKSYPPQNLQQLQVLPGVKEALEKLKSAGYLLIVVTNQPDVARGNQTREQVEEFHRALRQQFGLPIDDFRVCYHDDRDGCECRKPLPGMLTAAAGEYGLNLGSSFMIGDRWRDVEAGRRAGCRTIFLDHGYTEPFQAEAPEVRVRSLQEAAEWILSR